MAIPTPYSYRQYTGDGAAKDFAVPFPFLERVHVHVYLNQRELVATTDFTWTSDTQIRLNTAPQAPVGSTPAEQLTIRRITPEDLQIVQWKDGSYIIQEDLNDSDKQWLYLIQEHHDQLMLLQHGQGTIPGGGSPAQSLAFWNNLARNADPGKGTANEVANTVTTKDQKAGDWIADDKHVATTGAISERLDVIMSDTKPPDPPVSEIRQPGKFWVDTTQLQISYWDTSARAWINTGATGPQGPPGPNAYFGAVAPTDPTPYGLWFNTTRQVLFVKWTQGTLTQWVPSGGSAPPVPAGMLVAGNGVAADSANQIATIDQGVI